MVQLLWKKVSQFVIKLSIHLFYDPPISFLFTIQKTLVQEITHQFFLYHSKMGKGPYIQPQEIHKQTVVHPYKEILFSSSMPACQQYLS